MARRPTGSAGAQADAGPYNINSIDQMILDANEQGNESFETGRHIVTYSQEATDEGKSTLESLGLRMADARDFGEQAVNLADIGDADALVLPEIGVAIVTAPDFGARAVGLAEDTRNPVENVDPEYFMFAIGVTPDYMRGFRRAAEAIARDAGVAAEFDEADAEVGAEVLGATWGLNACKVPPSTKTGAGIRVAILDTGMTFNHPDFAGRQFVSNTFVPQPPQDGNGHGTHCTGTACGALAPPGTTPRYGIGHKVAPIIIGKVLTNAGGGTMASVLAGMNWAIANNATVISMSLGAPIGVQPAYTAAGQAALNKGLLIVAAAGNLGGQPTGAPANSPTIMAVASVDKNLQPSSFSSQGKIEIAGPGRDVFSSWLLPPRYNTISGTSMATPHVAGCAALWAQTSTALRGQALWNKLQATAKPLAAPPSRVGKGLVQAPA